MANIDKARTEIARGEWYTALKTLKGVKESNNRALGLTKLYEAVVIAETGVANRVRADEAYRKAINLLAAASPNDSWRAYNSYGVFLMNSAQDLLNNHAFQIASGVRHPLTSSLLKWKQAEEAFQYAEFVSAKVDEKTHADVLINQARLYSVLADILATISMSDAVSLENKSLLADSARQRARELCQTVKRSQQIDELARGCASEILAQLAFRAKDFSKAKKHADQALVEFVDAGSLVGAESVLRLKGMIELSGDPSSQKNGLVSLEVSNSISNILYDRIPGDDTGRSRAGFFSRRAYVSERIVLEQIKRGNAAVAIEYVEAAKARSLREVLATGKLNDKQLAKLDGLQGSVGEIVSQLDAGTVAIEYFLASESCYAFLITRDGVEARQLVNPDGSPVSSQKLIESVIRLQSNLRGQAKKMLERQALGKNLDNQWQADLHKLYRQLIPADFVEPVRSAKSLIIVPQHVLHYVPFAALVTKLDDNPNATERPNSKNGERFGGIAQPEFLIDAGMSITTVPSLVNWDLIRKRESSITSAGAVGIAQFAYAKPLVGVKKDLDNFRRIFGDHVRKVLPGDEASKANVIEMLKQPGLLMIGTHGENVADQPLESYLMCLEAEGMDGEQADVELTALEIFRTDVNAEMVVMSACHSGLADRSPLQGDDLFGLQRALLTSGASTVVSGLWDVFDGTGPELIEGQFQRMADGQSASMALADSQREFLDSRRKSGRLEFFLHPYFWSVYNISGDGSIKIDW